MTLCVRPSRNFVNLGSLYRIAPFKGRLPSWAYFDDGSMFIVRGHMEHEVLQMRMRNAAHLISQPGGRLHAQSMRRPRDTQTSRFILVGTGGNHFLTKRTIVSARSSSDGERVVEAGKPFLQFEFLLDRTGTRSPRVKFKAEDTEIVDQIPTLKTALRTFRGTLIDGILQPNVRPCNGLKLRGIQEVDPETKAEQLPKHEQKKVDRVMDEIITAKQALQARERELALYEELLRWKQKSFQLQKQLDRQRNNRIPREIIRLAPTSKFRKRFDQPFESRRSVGGTLPNHRSKDDHSFDSKYPVNHRPQKTCSEYKVRGGEATLTDRTWSQPGMEDWSPTHVSRPPVPLADEKPASTRPSDHTLVSGSTGDVFASYMSAPPALNELRSLFADSGVDNKSPRRRRRSR